MGGGWSCASKLKRKLVPPEQNEQNLCRQAGRQTDRQTGRKTVFAAVPFCMRTKRRKEEDTRCRWKKKKKKKTSHPVSLVCKKGSSQETAEEARSCEELLLSLNTD
jgi:hypothetical protein